MIKQYEKNGQKFWAVRVTKRSSKVGRIERSAYGLKSAQEAARSEKRLTEEVIAEKLRREGAGCTWSQLLEEWELALRQNRGFERAIGKTTGEDYVRALQIYTEVWMARPTTEITRQDVKDVLRNMEVEGLSNSRKRAVLNAINNAFRWATDNRLLPATSASPATGHMVSREEEKKPEILTLNEIRTLIRAAKDCEHPWFPIWAAALHTGCRSGELYALEWNDVDWENRKITLSKTYNRREHEVKCTKGRYWREVPINAEFEVLLKELKLAGGTRRHVLPRFKDWERGESARVLRAFCVGIGIPSVRFHALRACFATQLLRDKVAPAIVMKICGWKDLKTMQRYIRLAGIEIEGATDTLKIMPPAEVMGRVVNLFGGSQE